MKECVNDALVCTEQAFHYLNSLSSMLKLEAGKVRSTAAWRRTTAKRDVHVEMRLASMACEWICGCSQDSFTRANTPVDALLCALAKYKRAILHWRVRS
eukprot:1377532-Pleurochrysis_carterae.AAC.2